MSLTKWLAAVAVAFLMAGPSMAAEVSVGKIKVVAADKNQFVLVQPNGKEALYTVVSDGKISSEHKECKIGDLKEGMPAVVLYVTISKGLYAVAVMQGDPDKNWPTMHGTIKSLKGSNQFELTSGGKDVLFTLTDNGVVNTDKKNNESLSKLPVGYEVTVHYVKMADGGVYADCVEPQKKK